MTTSPSPSPSGTNLVVDDQELATLMWLTNRTSEEQKSLRELDDKLFSWAATLFITAFGALAGIKGLTTQEWGPLWRALLCLGIIGLVAALLVLASQIRVSVLRKGADLERLMSHMARNQQQQWSLSSADIDNGLFFYIRWGIITLLGAITLVLTWLTFS
ncbi:MAG: hypothetical protein KF726_25850 [Anaerolineae bacterium]|nr:hypothetical protein [Anaerolineae bacterium]